MWIKTCKYVRNYAYKYEYVGVYACMYVCMYVFIQLLTSLNLKVRSALGCNPIISGESILGNFEMYPIKSSISMKFGMRYTKFSCVCMYVCMYT